MIEDPWHKHTPGDPMPCKCGDSVVEVIFSTGVMRTGPAKGWDWGIVNHFPYAEVADWRFVERKGEDVIQRCADRRRSAQQIGGDMITADPDTFLGYLCRKVDEMKPGQRIDVSIHDLHREIPSFDYGGAMFSAPDRVLENIVGSSYTHSYTVNHERSTVTFERHENTGARHYLSPDRRPADRRRP